jgi:hypothetical protein
VNPLRIRLDLSRHCIETAIRRRYNRLVNRALRNEPGAADLETELELLQSALETLDFGRLRTEFTELGGHCSDLIELETEKPGPPRIRINGKPVARFSKRRPRRLPAQGE